MVPVKSLLHLITQQYLAKKLDFFFKAIGVLCTTFPDDECVPAILFQLRTHNLIPSYIVGKLFIPEIDAAFWTIRFLTPRVTVPETSMDKYNGSIFRQNDIGATKKAHPRV
jgi:hypothetical protein